MKPPRPRYAIRPLMAAGAILAVGVGLSGWLKRRPPPPLPEVAEERREEVHHGDAETLSMRKPTLPIAGLLLALGLIGIGLACLRSPASPWSGASLSALLAALTLAPIGVVYRRGSHRAFWMGFALCGLSYLTLSLAPWFDSAVRPLLVTTRAIQWAYPLMVPEIRQLGRYRPFVLESPVRVKGIDMDNLGQGPLDVLIEEEGKDPLPLAHDLTVGAANGLGPMIQNIVLLADQAQLAALERARCDGASLVLSRHAVGPLEGLWPVAPVSGRDFERSGHVFCAIVFAMAGGLVGRYFHNTNEQPSSASDRAWRG